jgi:hypothetical protein
MRRLSCQLTFSEKQNKCNRIRYNFKYELIGGNIVV